MTQRYVGLIRSWASLALVLLLEISILFSSGCGGSSSSSNSGGGTNPPPAIILTSMAPYMVPGGASWVVASATPFSLLVNGSGFTATSVLQWNGSPLPTQFGTGMNLAATVSSTLASIPGTVSITVHDSSTGLTSNALPFSIASAATASAGVVQMITVAPDASPANSSSLVTPAISATGRYVAFQSSATNLGAGAAGSYQQIYERDTCIGAPSGCVPSTIPITVTYDGTAPNMHSRTSSISADGRFVAFDTEATNILPNTGGGGTPGDAIQGFVFLRDTCIGAPTGCTPSTALITVDANGNHAGGNNPGISPDGRYITFNSDDPNVAGNNLAGTANVFLRDTCNNSPAGCVPKTFLVSQSTESVIGNHGGAIQEVNAGGRFVAFQSWSNNLIPSDTNAFSDIFVRDTCIGAPPACTPSTAIESLGLNGAYGNAGLDGTVVPSISSDGRYVAFASDSTNMAVGMTSNACGFNGNILVRDTCAGTIVACTPATTWVSVPNGGSLPNCGSNNQSMSADGRFIAFSSMATNLVPGDTFAAGWQDIFVRDTCTGAPAGCSPSTVRVSVANTSGAVTEANSPSFYPQISGDGHYVVFMSEAFNLIPGSNGYQMVFLAKTGF